MIFLVRARNDSSSSWNYISSSYTLKLRSTDFQSLQFAFSTFFSTDFTKFFVWQSYCEIYRLYKVGRNRSGVNWFNMTIACSVWTTTTKTVCVHITRSSDGHLFSGCAIRFSLVRLRESSLLFILYGRINGIESCWLRSKPQFARDLWVSKINFTIFMGGGYWMNR